MIRLGENIISNSAPFDLVGKAHLEYSGESLGSLTVSWSTGHFLLAVVTSARWEAAVPKRQNPASSKGSLLCRAGILQYRL